MVIPTPAASALTRNTGVDLAARQAARFLNRDNRPKISFDQFVREIPKQDYGKESLGARAVKSLSMLHRSHPTAVKVGVAALLALGIVAILAGSHVGFLSPVTAFLNAHVANFAWAPMLKAVGGVAIGVSSLAGINIALSYLPYGVFNYLIEAPPHIGNNERMFNERIITIDSGVSAEIRYLENEKGRAIPVCTISDASDPKKAGRAYGFIIAKQVSGILPLVRKARGLVGIPNAEEYPNNANRLLATLQREDPYMHSKLEGMVEGYNKWAEENGNKSRITLEELYFMHFPPERCGWDMPGESRPATDINRTPLGSNGCISITTRDTENGIIHASNTDWETMGIFARYGLLVVEKNVDGRGKNLAEFRIAGHAAGVWGVNSDGVFERMNVAVQNVGNQSLDRIPAFFYNNWILRNAQNADVDSLESPDLLSGYSLTVVDPNKARAFHMQGDFPHISYCTKTRTLGEGEDSDFMVFANPTYSDNGIIDMNVCHGDEREQRVLDCGRDFLRRVVDGNRSGLVQRMIALPQVNNGQTMCSTFYNAGEGVLGVAIDNSYASSNSFVMMQLTELWDAPE